jgi:asparagine synthase (glutamine-hydrolysing)
MRSDVPLASALSGGLDSSSVYSMVHYLSQQGETNERQAVQYKKAITATFPNTPMDEREYAEIVANKWGKENWVCVESDLKDPVKEIEKTTRLFDAVSGAAMNSISKIYEGVRNEGVIVSLDGHGVDEMLYGYRYMLDKLFYHYLKYGVLDKANSIKEALVNLYKVEDRAAAASRFDKLMKETAIQQKSFKTKIKKWLKPYRGLDSVKLSEVDTAPSNQLYDFSTFPYEEQILLNDFFIDSLPTFLRDFDRASMQHSVEVRMPFMDYRLVEFCFSLPLEQKLDKGFTKRILRDAMKGIVPDEIIDRTFKIGISSPLLDWFKGELKEYIIDQLHSEEMKVCLAELGFLTPSHYLTKLNTKQLSTKEASDIWFALNLKLIG